MKRTTVSLSDEVASMAEREARRREVSLSEIVRQALSEHLGIGKVTRRRLPFAKLGASGHRHTGRDFDEALAANWEQDIERHRDR